MSTCCVVSHIFRCFFDLIGSSLNFRMVSFKTTIYFDGTLSCN